MLRNSWVKDHKAFSLSSKGKMLCTHIHAQMRVGGEEGAGGQRRERKY